MWTRVAALIEEHSALQEAIGGAPSQWACYRFARKLRENKPLLDACIDRISESLREQFPNMGRDAAIDASDMPAYGNGQKADIEERAPSESGSAIRMPPGGIAPRSAFERAVGFYGYRIHAAVCAVTGLPLAWEVKTAREHETTAVPALLDGLRTHGFAIETVAMDKGYDNGSMHDACTERGAVAIFSLRQTPFVRRGDHLAPTCEHGTWTFAGADFKRGASKWRCPNGECAPKSRWIKASRMQPLIPRESKRWRDLYRGRAAVERKFGTLKHRYGLAPLRIRGLNRVRLHVDLDDAGPAVAGACASAGSSRRGVVTATSPVDPG